MNLDAKYLLVMEDLGHIHFTSISQLEVLSIYSMYSMCGGREPKENSIGPLALNKSGLAVSNSKTGAFNESMLSHNANPFVANQN